MSGGTQTDLSSPWTSGSWNFDPKKVSLVQPMRRKPRVKKSESVQKGTHRKKQSLKRFGLLPEQELLRTGYMVLFAFSGLILAALAGLLLW